MSDDDFTRGVEDGIRLSKRIYFGKDRSVAPPKPPLIMPPSRSFYPLSPMVYAVIYNPGIVDNPDVPSYQPHVHGRCDPPALIPLQMNGVEIELDCYVDTAFVTMSGSWRLHCVMGSAKCDCRLAIPMGGGGGGNGSQQGSILGVEVQVTRKSYKTHLVSSIDDENIAPIAIAKPEDGGFLKPNIFTLTIPQIDGGSNLSVKVRWSQKIIYKEGDFTLDVPFSFPEYVTPAGKKLSKMEKIQLTLNVGLSNTQVVCRTASHPLKEQKRQVGKLAFLYEAQVLSWSTSDFLFTYSVPTTNAFGGILLQAPSSFTIDQREMFSLYLFPGPYLSKKVVRKQVVFVVDISGSMKGRTIEATKNAVVAALSKLDQGDSFSIMAFNDQTYLYSSTFELATEEALKKATDWIAMNFIPGGGTNMSIALDQAIEMLSGTKESVPMIFFITDGAVENERQICQVMNKRLKNQGSDMCPRIYTFGIGSFCNHYFLRMLAMISRGHFEAAFDADSIVVQMEVLFSRAASTVLVNIAVDGLQDLDAFEIYPSVIADVCLEGGALMIYGHYRGGFPDILKVKGILADMSDFTIDLKVQRAKEIPLDELLVKQQIEHHTSQAWYLQDKKLEEKVAKMSMQSGVVSEYTRMVLSETVQVQEKQHVSTSSGVKKGKKETVEGFREKNEMIKVLQCVGVGFGNLIATIENTPPGYEPKLPDQAEMLVRAAGNCCVNLCGKCCCMCCIQACSRINDQCAVLVTQLITGLAFLGCFMCCELCCGGHG